MSCCYWSTTEGEPELTSTQNLQNQALYILAGITHSVPLHWCHDVRPHSGTVAYGIPWMEWISTHPTKKGSIQWVSHNHPGGRMEYTSKCPPPLLPSKHLNHIIHINCSAHYQVTAAKITNQSIHHSRPCLERSDIGTKPIALYTRCMLWLPAMEAQDTP